NSELKEILTAIQHVLDGKTHFDATLDPSFFNAEKTQSSADATLSKTEREILRYISQGKTSREIAEIRFSSVSTIDTHRKNMMRKLGLHGSGELYRYAIDKKYDFE